MECVIHPESALIDSALSHLRVLDLSRVLAGPWASQMLADLGADVVKVEHPDGGDETRSWGPPWLKDQAGAELADAAYYLCANRNKRSVTIDFSTPEGQRLVRDLALQSDVLIENLKPGSLARFGLDYLTLHRINPRLVYCSVTGFGQTGPYSPRAGYDFLIQGMGGLMSITGRPDGEPGEGPVKVGVALTDILTGLHAITAILAALSWRDRSGKGQHIDLALLDVQVACLANQGMNYLHGGRAPTRLGNAHPNVVPYQDFPTADGRMIIAVGNDEQFRRLCGAIDHPEWATDPRFAANAGRLQHRDTLVPMLREETRRHNTREWIARLERVAVPCGPINTIPEVFDDAQVRAREMQISMRDQQAGEVALVASPLRLSVTPVSYRRAPPRLGEHTREVLREWLGIAAEESDAVAGSSTVREDSPR